MAACSFEKRSSARVKTDFAVSADKGFTGSAVDLCEGGMRLSSQDSIESPTITLTIHFPKSSGDFKTKAKLVWKREFDAGGAFYGLEFMTLSRAQKAYVRKMLIEAQITGLLGQVQDQGVREQIRNFFLKDMLAYISQIHELFTGYCGPESYSLKREEELDRWNNQILLKGYALGLLLSDEALMKNVKHDFRQLAATWIYKSTILEWAGQGKGACPLDFKMLESVYDNRPVSAGIGAYFDRIFLKSPFAVAVRSRKDYCRKILKEFFHERQLPECRILNIACGSCREIKELLPDLHMHHAADKTGSKAEGFTASFTCLDEDPAALSFAEERLLSQSPHHVRFKFIQADFLNSPTVGEDWRKKLGGQHLIYSLSLADYLSDVQLKKIITGTHSCTSLWLPPT